MQGQRCLGLREPPASLQDLVKTRPLEPLHHDVCVLPVLLECFIAADEAAVLELPQQPRLAINQRWATAGPFRRCRLIQSREGNRGRESPGRVGNEATRASSDVPSKTREDTADGWMGAAGAAVATRIPAVDGGAKESEASSGGRVTSSLAFALCSIDVRRLVAALLSRFTATRRMLPPLPPCAMSSASNTSPKLPRPAGRPSRYLPPTTSDGGRRPPLSSRSLGAWRSSVAAAAATARREPPGPFPAHPRGCGRWATERDTSARNRPIGVPGPSGVGGRRTADIPRGAPRALCCRCCCRV